MEIIKLLLVVSTILAAVPFVKLMLADYTGETEKYNRLLKFWKKFGIFIILWGLALGFMLILNTKFAWSIDSSIMLSTLIFGIFAIVFSFITSLKKRLYLFIYVLALVSLLSFFMPRSFYQSIVSDTFRPNTIGTPGFTKLAPSAVVIIGYGIAFYFLSLVLKSIPVGVAYAVWSGLGVVIITAIAWLLHGQKLDAWGFVGMGLIIAAFLLARSPSWKSLRRPTPW